MLKLKKIKPIGSQVLVTENHYGWDDVNESGIIIHFKGDIKSYQEVIAVGKDVTFTKPGDVVEINFYKYAELDRDPDSVKSITGSSRMVSLRLNEVDLEGTDGKPVTCFLIDQRDIKYILEDYDEVTYREKKEILVKQPEVKLILPDNKIQV